jgi:hypothetical protein
VTAVAAVQHGVVSRDQLRAAGVSDGAVTGMVARGELVRVYRGVYRLSPVVHVPLAREVAALLACGPEAVLSHRTAADLWALPVALSRGLHVVRRAHGPEPVGVTVHRSRTLTAQDIRHRHGLPLTSPARTLLDLAETLTPRQLERAVDEALVKHIVRPSTRHWPASTSTSCGAPSGSPSRSTAGTTTAPARRSNTTAEEATPSRPPATSSCARPPTNSRTSRPRSSRP